jgi:hypothetical protein
MLVWYCELLPPKCLPLGAKQLATHITDLQTKLRIEQTEQGRIALVGCETDKPSSSGTAAEITGNITVVWVFFG